MKQVVPARKQSQFKNANTLILIMNKNLAPYLLL